MIEVVTIIGVIILSVTSVGGWVYTLRKNGRAEGRLQQQVDSLVAAVAKLPCQADANYLQGIGSLTEAVKNLDGWLKTVEGEQKETNRRIDKIIERK